MRQKTYPSDLTDSQWALLDPLLPPSNPNTRPRKHPMREVVNALLYVTKEGCTWRALPADFGVPWKTVYNYFRAWTADGTLDRLVDVLRRAVRVKAGRKPGPSAGSIDSQSARSALGGDDIGIDGGKKVRGRKRHIAVDTLGLLLVVAVTAANVDDARGAELVFGGMTAEHRERLVKVWADGKYHNYALNDFLAAGGYEFELEIVGRPAGEKGFRVLPWRWVVERTFAWLGWSRRLSKDYERLAETSAGMVKLAAIRQMVHRLKPRRTYHRYYQKRNKRNMAA
jgi:putative transposase